MDDADVLSVLLVRCPKCQKLFPEPSNYLIYRCGDCDAVLRVKKKAPSMNAGFPADGLKESENHYVTDKLVDHVSDTWGPNDVLDSNTLKTDLIQWGDGFRRSTLPNQEVEDDDKRAQSEIRSNWRSTESWPSGVNQIDNGSKYRQAWMEKSDRSESVNSSPQKDILETSSRMNRNDAAQLDSVREWISKNYGDMLAVSSHAREDEKSFPFPTYRQNKSFRRYASMYGSSRGSPMGTDHAELLRKLEHLKLEISRIYEVPERTGNMLLPEDRRMYNSLPGSFAQPNPAEQHLYTKNHFGQFPYTPGSGMNMQDVYGHPGYLPNYPREYRDRGKPPMPKPSYQFAPKSVMEFSEDSFRIHSHEPFVHPHMCSCLSCSQKYQLQFRSPVRQTTFGIGGTPKLPSISDLYCQTDSVPIWPPHGIDSVASTPARSHHSRFPGSWPNDVHSDMDNLCSRRNSLPVHQGFKKYCHPLAGGAPFTTCPKCLELLKLPQVFKVKRLSIHNMQCGSCFNIFQVNLRNRQRDTFITRKFPLVDETGSDESGNERNKSPDRHSIADGTTYGERNVVEPFPASSDDSKLKFQQGNSQHDEQSESRELSARMSESSRSFTSVSSEDPILSNNVLRGRILLDVAKHKNPTMHKELNANIGLNSKSLSASSVSSQEQHGPNDVISGRILAEESLRNDHEENQELNSDSKRFIVHLVASEEQNLSNEVIATGIPEEEALRTDQTRKELNGSIDRNSQSFAASSVSSEEQNLSYHGNVERILCEESQKNDLAENQDLSEIMGQKSKIFTASSNLSEEPNTSHDVVMGWGVNNATEEPSTDAFSAATPSVDTVWQLLDSFTEIEPSQSTTDIEVTETETKSGQKENTVNEIVVEPDVDFSFIGCLSSNAFTDAKLSNDENSQTTVGKWAETSLVSFITKSFNDFSRYQQNEDDERTNVTINGHPITKQDLKKAEMQAGRVLPGHYWYDYYGGFWGVMGEPCLGIISTFIKEFGYPLQANCAAGNTDVFVNGRELHQLDLELLASRGLPTARNRAYKIDICGTVYDERTGEELKSLGLLAPSVIRAKRGFGMGVPAKYEYSVTRG